MVLLCSVLLVLFLMDLIHSLLPQVCEMFLQNGRLNLLNFWYQNHHSCDGSIFSAVLFICFHQRCYDFCRDSDEKPLIYLLFLLPNFFRFCSILLFTVVLIIEQNTSGKRRLLSILMLISNRHFKRKSNHMANNSTIKLLLLISGVYCVHNKKNPKMI